MPPDMTPDVCFSDFTLHGRPLGAQRLKSSRVLYNLIHILTTAIKIVVYNGRRDGV